MPDQMYPQPDEPDATSAAPQGADGEGEEKPDDQKMEGETALLPKSILGGKEFNPGDEVVLKIVGMHEDEVEVSYASEKSGSAEKPGADDGGEMGKAQGRLSSMGGAGGAGY